MTCCLSGTGNSGFYLPYNLTADLADRFVPDGFVVDITTAASGLFPPFPGGTFGMVALNGSFERLRKHTVAFLKMDLFGYQKPASFLFLAGCNGSEIVATGNALSETPVSLAPSLSRRCENTYSIADCRIFSRDQTGSKELILALVFSHSELFHCQIRHYTTLIVFCVCGFLMSD
jgi:hypothetical protein